VICASSSTTRTRSAISTLYDMIAISMFTSAISGETNPIRGISSRNAAPDYAHLCSVEVNML
jgi:hypothetical protein